MAYCGPKGIPLSVFLSWPEADQEAALAWQAHENRRCSGCGTHPDDWSPKAGGDRHAYHPEHDSCPGCAALERYRESKHVQESKRHGLQIRLAPGLAKDCDHCKPLITR